MTPMDTETYFTADTHFEHDLIVTLRKDFKTAEEHNEAMVQAINKTVGYHARLFILGDFAFRGGESWFKRITCRDVHLIIGNHDRAGYSKFFKTAEDTGIVRYEGNKIFMSHYAHAYWPASHKGSVHVYGHTHAQREETLDKLFPDRRSMDVGMDNAKILLGDYIPFSARQICERLLVRRGHDLVSDMQREKGSWK